MTGHGRRQRAGQGTRARWLGVALAAAALAPASARAITVNAVGTQQMSAGTDYSLSVGVTGQATSTIRWSVDWVSPDRVLGCTESASANRTDMPLWSSSGNTVNATLTLPGRATAQLLGTSCMIITACEYYYTPFPHYGNCDDEAFSGVVSISSSSALLLPTLYAHQHRQYLAGDSAPMPVPVNMWSTRIIPTTAADRLVELVSCPAGWSCSPPTLPDWVSLNWSNSSGPTLDFLVPAGPPGEWVFRPTLPPLSSEYEFNGDYLHANYLRVGTATNGDISPAADADFYAIYAEAGDTIDVWTATSSTSYSTCVAGFDTYLTLYDTDGSTALINNNDSGTNQCSRIAYTVPSTGTYFLRAIENGNNAVLNNYYLHLLSPANRSPVSLTVHLMDPADVDPGRSLMFPGDKRFLEVESANDSVDTAPSIVGNGVLTGSIDAPGDVDNYGFYAYTATYDSFEVLDLDGTCTQDTVLTLYDKLASGSLVQLAQNNDWGASTCPRLDDVLVEPGHHYILRVEENGGDAAVYGYTLRHRSLLADVEPANNDPATAPELMHFGSSTLNPGVYALWVDAVAIRTGVSASDPTDYYILGIGDAEHVVIETGDGLGGCPGDTYLKLYDYNPPAWGRPEPGSFSWSYATLVASNDNSGVGACSRIVYTTPLVDHFYILELTRVGTAAVDPVVLSYSNDGKNYVAPSSTPKWHDQDDYYGPFQFDKGATADPMSVTYGDDRGVVGFYPRHASDATNLYAAYSSGIATSSLCDPVNIYLFSTARGWDGDNACRTYVGAPLPTAASSGWTRVPTFNGTLFAFIPSSSDVGNVGRSHFVTADTNRAYTAHAKGTVNIAGTTEPSVTEVLASYGENAFYSDVYGQCGAKSSTCDLGKTFYEGDRVLLYLKRPNRLNSASLARCSDDTYGSCALSLLGATYSTSSDYFLWDIPYTAVSSGTTRFFFKVTSTGNAGRGEPDGSVEIEFDVTARAAPPSGADLLIYQVRAYRPIGYRAVDSRVYGIGLPYFLNTFLNPALFYPWIFAHNESYGRSLAQGDAIYVHPLFELGELGDAVGPATVDVRVLNRGGAAASSTYLDAFVVPVHVDAGGELVADPPGPSDTPYSSHYVTALAASGVSSETVSLPFIKVMPYAGAYPWEGFPSALYLRLRGGAVNTLAGPYIIKPPPYISPGFCPTCAITPEPDVTGYIASVTPASPVEGDLVTVQVITKFNSPWPNAVTSYLRFYKDQATPPTSGTSYTTQQTLTVNPVGEAPYGHTFTFTALKPGQPDNTVHLRALLDATNTVGEGTSGEANNQLPSVAAAWDLVIANSAPTFNAPVTTASLTEDVLWSYNFQFTDNDDVDLSRLAFSVTSGPSGLATNGAIYTCGSYRCQNVRWTPTDAQAVTGSHSATVRVCDGDPVAGGAGACTSHSWTLNVTRVNDAPVITSGAPTSTGTENAAYSFDINATDEEGTTLTYSLITAPSGMTINASTGLISWTPNDNHIGSNAVTVRVTDQVPAGASGVRTTDQSWTITVANVNDNPTLGTLSPLTGTEGVAYSALARILDDDVDVAHLSQTLSCSLQGGVPSWLSASAVTISTLRYCQLTGTPGNPATGPQSVTLLASDGVGGSGSRAYTVTITDVNQDPTFLSSPGAQSATQGTQWSLVLSVDDPDLASPAAAETLTYSRLAGPALALTPAGDQRSVTLTWTPGPLDANTTPSVTIQVEDRRGAIDTVSFSFNTIANVNDPPYWDPAPSNVTLAENQALSTVLQAGDPDADVGLTEVLTFSIVGGAPPGLAVNPASGALSFTNPGGLADDAQVGVWSVTVRVRDDQAPTPAQVDAVFTLTVTNVNDPPVITSSGVEDVDEDASYSYTLTYVDPDVGDGHTLSAPLLPAWLQFNPATGALTSLPGHPDNDDVGDHPVELEVADALVSDIESFVITVHNTNDAPLITSTAITAATQDQPYSYTLVASDGDLVHGDHLTLSAPQKPAWLAFNTTSGLLAGVPGNAEVGSHPVTLRVTDDLGAFVDQPFTIVVANVNDPPVLASIGPRSVAEGATLQFTVSASDPDGTTPIVSVTPATLPLGASFDGTTFTWATGFGDEGTYLVEFVASDGLLLDSELVTVSVGNVPRPPVLDPIGNRSVAEAATLSFTVTAADPDAGDTVTLGAAGGASNPFGRGAIFTPATGAFSWTPGYADAGTYSVTFTVTDSTGLSDSETISIVVSDSNRSPGFVAAPPASTPEDALFSYLAVATDPDGDTLTWSLLLKPTGMTIVAATGAIAWTPTNAQVGSHDVTVQVSDGKPGGVATLNFTLVVTNVNDAPTISSTPLTAIAEDALYSYTLVASDQDVGDVLTLSAPTRPAWLSFDPSSGLLSGTPLNADVGTHPVVLRATDLAGAFAQQSFSVVVSNVNDAPQLVPPTPSGTVAGAEGSLLTFTVAATDVDGPSLSYGGTGLPAGAAIHPTTGVFTWTPPYDAAGQRAITVYADDTLLRDSRVLTLDIANTDRDPTLTAPASQGGSEGQPLSFVVSGSDPDGDPVVLSLSSGPAGASFDPAQGRFSWTPGYDQAGTYDAVFVATANGRSVSATTSLSIANVNRPPVVSSSPLTTATEDQPYSYAIVASDPDGQSVRFAAVSVPSGVSVDAQSGLVTWTPSGAQTGLRGFDILVTDDQGGDLHHTFTVDVAAVNDPPVFTSSPVISATEDQPYAYAASATDEEDATLSYALVQGPTGMSVGAQSGQVSWLPANADVGSHAVVLSATDSGGQSVQQSFTVVVANVNDAPVFAALPAPAASVVEGATWSWTPSVSDPDVGDSVTLSLVQAPAGMTLVGGTLQWTPGNADVGTHQVRVRATDLNGASTLFTHTLTVVNLNDPPFFTTPAINASVAEESGFAFAVEAQDIDADDTLTYLLVGAPAGMQIDPLTGWILFAPDDPEVGTHDFTVRVQDAAGAFAEQAARLIVTPVNDPPVIATIGNHQVPFDTLLTFSIAVSDPDGPSLTLSASGLPAGASLVGAVFSWTPGLADAGAYTVTFTASDGSLSDSETITIVAGDGGLPPSIDLPPDATVDEGTTLTASITAVDPQTALAVPATLSSPPGGASYDEASGAFSWTPSFDAAGSYALEFSAQNGAGVTRRTWQVTVRNVNRPPQITTVTLPPALEGQSYSVPVEASDPDGDTLNFSLINAPSGMSIGASSGLLQWLPGYAAIGVRTLRVRVEDGHGGQAEVPYTVVVDFIDVDHDAMPDTWEGLVGTDPARDDAAEDPDGDGLSNLAEYLAGSDPFVSNAPMAPLLVSPADLARLDTATPSLVWEPATDPDGDPVTYTVELWRADDPGTVVFGLQDLAGSGSPLHVAVDLELTEGATYAWCVWASDGTGATRSAVRGFVVDVVNEPPPAPMPLGPADEAWVGVATPLLEASQVVDPDGDRVSYRFRLRGTVDGPIEIQSDPIAPPASGPVGYTVPQLLAHGTTWFWDVVATDARGLEGPASVLFQFSVDLLNLPPPAPTLLAPLDGARVRPADAELRLGAVQDPEGALVRYRVALSPDGLFDVGTTVALTGLQAGVDDVVRVDLSALSPDGTWWLRAWATDGVLESEPRVASFVLDLVEQPPPAPTLLAPADSSEVSLPVLLRATTVTDPDGEDLVYRFELTTPDGSSVLALVENVADGDDGAVDGEVQVLQDSLTPGTRYGWRVQAITPDGSAGAYSARWSFRVASPNLRPAAPQLLEPVDVSVPSARPTLRFAAAVDPEGDAVEHELELLDAGDSVVAQAAQLLAVAGEVQFTPGADLASGSYRWRARGRDAVGPGPWAEASFQVQLPGQDAGSGSDSATVADGAGVDAGGGGDAGAVDAAGQDAAAGDAAGADAATLDGAIVGTDASALAKADAAGIVTDVGYRPLPVGCGCAASGAPVTGLALVVVPLVLLWRRRRG